MTETAEQYIQRILGHVEGQDPIKVQRSTAAKLKKLTQRLTPKQLKWKPEPEKWSIAEILRSGCVGIGISICATRCKTFTRGISRAPREQSDDA
jgi:hypothetical protein